MNVPMERVVLMLRTYGMLEIGDVPTSDLVMRLTPSDIINRETKKTKYLRNSSFRERVLLFSIISKRRLTNAATKLQIFSYLGKLGDFQRGLERRGY